MGNLEEIGNNMKSNSSKPNFLLLQEEVRELMVHHRLRENGPAPVEAIQISVNEVTLNIIHDICNYKKKNMCQVRKSIAKQDVAFAINALANNPDTPARNFYKFVSTLGNLEKVLGQESDINDRKNHIDRKQLKRKCRDIVGDSGTVASTGSFPENALCRYSEINDRFLKPRARMRRAFLEGYRYGVNTSNSANTKKKKKNLTLLQRLNNIQRH